LDDLKSIQELDRFGELKKYIKNIILSSENLWKIIYYPLSNPLDSSYGENPFDIFDEATSINNNGIIGTHGVVLFKQKNDNILNAEAEVVIIGFESNAINESDCINTTKIEIKILSKGTNIQTLIDKSNRAYKIAELIDNQFNHANITDVGKIKRQAFNDLLINEENCGYILSYTCIATDYNDEIKIYNHSQIEDEWGITRESYNLLVTESPILVDIQPCTDSKITQQYGYNIDSTRTMYCAKSLEITESTIVKYNDKYYKIQKIIENDDYLNCSLVVTYTSKIN
jgi:hypothetical protein